VQESTFSCFTELLHERYGETSQLSWLYCDKIKTPANYNTSYYKTRPANNIPATPTTDPTTTPTTTTRPPTKTDSSTPTPTDPTSPPNNGGNDKSNTGAIAGGVVGGIAVLAIAGVAIFWLMRRNKNKQAAAAAATGTLGPAGLIFHDENKPANVAVGGIYPREGHQSSPIQHDPSMYPNIYEAEGQMGVGGAQGGSSPHGQMYPGGAR